MTGDYSQSRRGYTAATRALSTGHTTRASARAIRGRTHPHPSTDTARDAAHVHQQACPPTRSNTAPIGHPRFAHQRACLPTKHETLRRCQQPRRVKGMRLTGAHQSFGAAPASHTRTNMQACDGTTSTEEQADAVPPAPATPALKSKCVPPRGHPPTWLRAEGRHPSHPHGRAPGFPPDPPQAHMPIS